jgi:hypothetical protein
MKRAIFVAILGLSLVGGAFADEGMWLFNAPPKARLQKDYNFTPTQQWLDHVRLSSVRFNNGGSGSFVSADGLTFTNHHVAQTCIHGLSTGGKDYYKTGFYAKSVAEEPKCPDLELNVLEGIEDVTAKVNEGVKPGMPDAEAGNIQRANTANIEKDCSTKSGLRCDVITFYSGAVYNLYKYKKYTDVRLVFAPEFDIAFFGGDPDNFEYPRYDLDITFFRVYENNKPVHFDAQHHFMFSKTGIKADELVFVSGNPGSTDRLDTMSQMEFLRDVAYPFSLQDLARRIELMKKYASGSPEHALQTQALMFGLSNSEKAVKGYQSGLLDQQLMAKKQAEEKSLRDALAANPQWQKEYGDPWTQIAKAEQVDKEIFLPLTFIERAQGFRGALPGIARTLVRAAYERQKPNTERLPEYRESGMASLQQRLFASTPIYKPMDEVQLADSMKEMSEKLPGNELLKKVLDGKTPDAAATEWIAATKLNDIAVRKQIWEGGVKAIETSTDPLIVLMREIDPQARELRKKYDDEVESVDRLGGASIARIRFAKEGMNLPPDATFTLRLSYGKAAGYTEDGRGTAPAGTKLPYSTTMGGAFEHQARHDAKPPYKLPESWMNAKSAMKLNTPLNFVSTSDIIGGNSGSPTVNRNAEVVGIVFDMNVPGNVRRVVHGEPIGTIVSTERRVEAGLVGKAT